MEPTVQRQHRTRQGGTLGGIASSSQDRHTQYGQLRFNWQIPRCHLEFYIDSFLHQKKKKTYQFSSVLICSVKETLGQDVYITSTPIHQAFKQLKGIMF